VVAEDPEQVEHPVEQGTQMLLMLTYPVAHLKQEPKVEQ
jgi:hypothetical protein